MTTAMDGKLSSARYALPGTFDIDPTQFPPPVDVGNVNAQDEVESIVSQLRTHLDGPDVAALSRLFASSGYWRDHLMLSWTFRTVQGPAPIQQFLQSCSESRDGFRLNKIELDDSSPTRKAQSTFLNGAGTVAGIQCFLRLDSVLGSGEGVIRLANEHGKWKIFSLYTCLQGLKGHDFLRPRGGPGTGLNWVGQRAKALNYEDGSEPAVMVLGAGHAGLTAAARLKALGINTLVVDKNARIGDNWRNRYHQLVLHDPVWYDHLPYLPFPPQWPVFTPKDKLAGWFEFYAASLELNVWMDSEIQSSSWSDERGCWTVQIRRKLPDGSIDSRTFHPRHIVQATGHSGLKNQPSIAGSDSFLGRRICHSSEFPGAEGQGQGFRAVVVGSCNSALDIAQDYANKGFDVTIVQRSSACILSSAAVLDIYLKGIYAEDGMAVDDADLFVQSVPAAMMKAIHIDITKAQQEHDRDMLDGLAKAGFELDTGPFEAGAFFKYFQRGGGYYIDVGAAKLIAEGRIKVRQGHGVSEVLPQGLRLDDDSVVEADEIVFATGYQSMRSVTRQVFGDDVANRTAEVWGYNEEGEIRTIWQKTGHPGFWLHGGNMALCRYYSRLLALQIKGLEENLYKYAAI